MPRHLMGTALFLLLSSGAGGAAEQGEIDSVLQGFDEPAAVDSIDSVLQGFDSGDDATALPQLGDTKRARNWQLGGSLTLSASYNYAQQPPATGKTDYRGLSRLRSKLNLSVDGKLGKRWQLHSDGFAYYDALYDIRDDNAYSDEVIDNYREETELGEAWLQGKLGSQTDLKLGRQIVVWGKSDNIRITDILNPLDNREPGMVDIQDLRLPLAMARLDFYTGNWGITALVIPEIRFNKNPPYGSDFYPFATPMPEEDMPSGNEYGVAANGMFSGWDLSLYAAQLYDDTPHRVIVNTLPRLQHSQLNMGGIAANMVSGNWLFKGERAHFSGLEYSSLPNLEFERSDSLLGIEYAGFADTSLSLEVANRHLHDYDIRLANDNIQEDEWQSALRYSGDFMHARLHLLAVISAFGEKLDEGGFGRYSAAYDIADGLTFTGGVVAYESGDKLPFAEYGNNDRLFVELKYSF